jgi:hypothetical protein
VRHGRKDALGLEVKAGRAKAKGKEGRCEGEKVERRQREKKVFTLLFVLSPFLSSLYFSTSFTLHLPL